MKIGIYAVGRLKAGPEKELASRYLDRFAKAGPQCGLEFTRSVELNESRAGNADTRKREEAQELSRQIPDGALIVVLDERGKAFDPDIVDCFVRNHGAIRALHDRVTAQRPSFADLVESDGGSL